MNIMTNQVCATSLVIILTIVPASGVLAQTHKGKHAMGQATAQPKAKAAVQQHVAATAQPAKPTAKADPQNSPSHLETHHQPPKTSEELVASLHSTRTHLTQASHDPLGHKTRALREINSAIKLLSTQTRPTDGSKNGQGSSNSGRAAGASGTSSSAGTPATTGSTSPATSATHLAEAQKQLQSIESQMQSGGINAHQYTQARNSVQNAIRELNLALVDR